MILRIATPPPYGYVVVTVYEARGVFGLVLRYKVWRHALIKDSAWFWLLDLYGFMMIYGSGGDWSLFSKETSVWPSENYTKSSLIRGWDLEHVWCSSESSIVHCQQTCATKARDRSQHAAYVTQWMGRQISTIHNKIPMIHTFVKPDEN